jgi:hypothetical protein
MASIVGLVIYLATSETLGDLPLCVFRYLGRPCPTCGTTRSLWNVLHGNLTTAWSLNPIGFLVVVVLARRLVVLSVPRHPIVRLLEHPRLDAALLATYFALGSMRVLGVV